MAIITRNAHLLQHPFRLGQRRFAPQLLMQADRLGDLLPNGKHRVEGGHRLLENHRNIGSAHAAHLRLA